MTTFKDALLDTVVDDAIPLCLGPQKSNKHAIGSLWRMSWYYAQ